MYFHNRDEEAATNLNSWSLSFLKTKVHLKIPDLIIEFLIKSESSSESSESSLESSYRSGFQRTRPDDETEETYPLTRFRRDIILCLLIQAFLFVAASLLLKFNTPASICFVICFILSSAFLLSITWPITKIQ